MSAPTTSGWAKIKRLARYLVKRPRLVYQFHWQESCGIETSVDSDWAGCPKTRKSTSGGMVFRGGHLLKHWASTQKTIALSSGEAELAAIVKGACESMGMRSLCRDLGINAEAIGINTDSSAASGVVRRKGMGRIRHIEVAELWVQDAQKQLEFELRKVKGEDNVSDMCTKYVEGVTLDRLVGLTWLEWRAGRAGLAPTLP